MLIVHHDWRLVAASVLVAMLTGFSGLMQANELAAMPVSARKLQIAKAAATLGGGVWTVHLVGVFAMQIPASVRYDGLAPLGAALVAVLGTGIALGLLRFGECAPVRIVCMGVVMGLGIVSVHYIGMSAIRGNCVVSHEPIGVLLSATIGVAASIGVLWLVHKTRSLRDVVLGGVAFGLSVSAMRYAAMIHTRFDPTVEVFVIPDPILAVAA